MSFSNYEKEIIELKFTELNNYLDARKNELRHSFKFGFSCECYPFGINIHVLNNRIDYLYGPGMEDVPIDRISIDVMYEILFRAKTIKAEFDKTLERDTVRMADIMNLKF